MEKTFTVHYKEHQNQESLSASEKELIKEALEAQQKAYAPYSNFQVGAALLLEDGTIVTGNNQENAAYPSGICAERTAIFYAQAQYPDKKIKALVVTASANREQTKQAVYPCGSCRQVLLESEMRNGEPFKVICYGTEQIVELPSATSLVPLHFVFK